MIELALSDETVTRVRKMAAQVGERPETLVERAVRQYLRAETQRAMFTMRTLPLAPVAQCAAS